ncbi:acyl-CoA thioester hydrolase [Evansella vedderi]|uniref:Acyl-CoA thioester hydrolase n=1 Tax=Evansella vedderi TaxID=38282 RepID=A0ABU0A4D8_9BACI|nr:thioesterase family protein [Evansella vedderi]MDQ0257543.1 acyl-CoA thioester hydrolase [Evansella vedderi]
MLISTEKIAVRYAETDQMGVVYHSNYLVWCEIGRTKLFEDLGYQYASLEKMGILVPVTNVNMNYHYPAKYGDTVTVRSWIEEYNGLRITYGYEIINEDGKQCLTGTSEHVCVKKDSFRPVSLKKQFPDVHDAYEKNKKDSHQPVE